MKILNNMISKILIVGSLIFGSLIFGSMLSAQTITVMQDYGSKDSSNTVHFVNEHNTFIGHFRGTNQTEQMFYTNGTLYVTGVSSLVINGTPITATTLASLLASSPDANEGSITNLFKLVGSNNLVSPGLFASNVTQIVFRGISGEQPFYGPQGQAYGSYNSFSFHGNVAGSPEFHLYGGGPGGGVAGFFIDNTNILDLASSGTTDLPSDVYDFASQTNKDDVMLKTTYDQDANGTVDIADGAGYADTAGTAAYAETAGTAGYAENAGLATLASSLWDGSESQDMAYILSRENHTGTEPEDALPSSVWDYNSLTNTFAEISLVDIGPVVDNILWISPANFGTVELNSLECQVEQGSISLDMILRSKSDPWTTYSILNTVTATTSHLIVYGSWIWTNANLIGIHYISGDATNLTFWAGGHR